MTISKPDADSTMASETLSIRAAPPRATLRLRRQAVIVSSVVMLSLLGIVVLHAFSPSKFGREQISDSRRGVVLGEMVRGLPDNYSAIRPERQQLNRAASRPGASPEGQAVDKHAEELRANRLKQAAAAQAADVSFSASLLPRTQTSSLSVPAREERRLDQLLGITSPPSTRDEANRQDDKAAFLKSVRTDSPYLPSLLRDPLSPFQVMAGSVIPGVLITGINSDLPGQITGQVSQNIYDSVSGKFLLIPQGTKVIGEYDSRISYGQERVLIVWTRLLFPNGSSLALDGMPGVDLSGYAGLHDRVNHHYLRLLTGVVFGSLLGAGAQVAQGANQSVNPSFDALALQGAAQNINDAGQQITRRNLNLQPTLEISPGQRFNIFVTKDLILEPYKPVEP